MEQIMDSEFSNVESHLRKYPIFGKLLSEEWLNKEILNKEARLQKHVLFWYLLKEDTALKLASDLKIIERDTHKNSFVSKIKKNKFRDNFDPFIIELLVYAFYKQKENNEFKISYEPPVNASLGNKSPKNDILIKYKNDNYYIEIFTITEDERDRKNLCIPINGDYKIEVRTYNHGRRIKDKLLDKFKNNQSSSNIKNILITCLLDPTVRFNDYYNGLIGQEYCKININSKSITPFRQKNGAIYDENQSKYGCFIVFKGLNFENRKKQINPNVQNKNKIDEGLFDML